jgi:hypothetical protein
MPDVVPIFLRVPRAEIGYLKFIFESYEGLAVVRTLDRHAGVLVVLAVPDLLADTDRVLDALATEFRCERIESPFGAEVDLLGPDQDNDA